MILPSDEILNRSVEYYDPARKLIFLEKSFWQRYFSMLMKDFKAEMKLDLNPLRKRRLASMVKELLYDYWYTKFIQGKEYRQSLWREMNRIFMSFIPGGFDSIVQSGIAELETATELRVEEAASIELDGSEIVDTLVNDYAKMELDSVRELELEAIVECASRCYYNIGDSIEKIKEDHANNKFEIPSGDISISKIIDFCYDTCHQYRENSIPVGEITLWNCLDLKEIRHNAVFQDFSINRFNNFVRQYSSIMIFKRLLDRIGYDICEIMYKRFMENCHFIYADIYEYCFCTIFLVDFCKRSIVKRSVSVGVGQTHFIRFGTFESRDGFGLFRGNSEKRVQYNVPTDSSSSVSNRLDTIGISLFNPSKTVENPMKTDSSDRREPKDRSHQRNSSIFSSNGGSFGSNSTSYPSVYRQN